MWDEILAHRHTYRTYTQRERKRERVHTLAWVVVGVIFSGDFTFSFTSLEDLHKHTLCLFPHTQALPFTFLLEKRLHIW